MFKSVLIVALLAGLSVGRAEANTGDFLGYYMAPACSDGGPSGDCNKMWQISRGDPLTMDWDNPLRTPVPGQYTPIVAYPMDIGGNMYLELKAGSNFASFYGPDHVRAQIATTTIPGWSPNGANTDWMQMGECAPQRGGGLPSPFVMPGSMFPASFFGLPGHQGPGQSLALLGGLANYDLLHPDRCGYVWQPGQNQAVVGANAYSSAGANVWSFKPIIAAFMVYSDATCQSLLTVENGFSTSHEPNVYTTQCVILRFDVEIDGSGPGGINMVNRYAGMFQRCPSDNCQ